eukprot:665862-Pelagomonas_calceolata.AAC.4
MPRLLGAWTFYMVGNKGPFCRGVAGSEAVQCRRRRVQTRRHMADNLAGEQLPGQPPDSHQASPYREAKYKGASQSKSWSRTAEPWLKNSHPACNQEACLNTYQMRVMYTVRCIRHASNESQASQSRQHQSRQHQPVSQSGQHQQHWA